ncbi:hypothetical protein A5826_001245 [Enterococcus faecium]|nr:hypothetical protein A5826_001245 [Enterococcus faecium]RBS57614.1 hypothetical protein EB35_01049 [Enterococcus faecium]
MRGGHREGAGRKCIKEKNFKKYLFTSSIGTTTFRIKYNRL